MRSFAVSRIDAVVQDLDRFFQIDLQNPNCDRAAVERGVHRHLREIDDSKRTIRWVDSPEEAYGYAFKLGSRELMDPALRLNFDRTKRALGEIWSKLGLALPHRAERDLMRAVSRVTEYSAKAAAWEAVWRATSANIRIRANIRNLMTEETRLWAVTKERRITGIDPINGFAEYIRASVVDVRDSHWASPFTKLVCVWRPIVDAAESGLFRYWVTSKEVICLPSPCLFITDHRLHRENGPAVQWSSGRRHWFWHGVEVPEWFIEDFNRVTADTIRNERNLELRRCMIERFGAERLIGEIGGELVATDGYGKLWRCRLDGNDAYAVVEVENGTGEFDGGRRRYWLTVPTYVRTPREAVAWTYGLQPDEYEVVART
jgi:hypothetical protein